AGGGIGGPDRRLVHHGGVDARASQPRHRDPFSPVGRTRAGFARFLAMLDASLPDLAAVVLPLAVADLPVMLWCRCARLFSLPDFPQLAKIAHKLIFDSAAFPDPAAALAQIGESSRSGRILGDLAWTRLTRWRGLVSQIFESRDYLARLPEIAEIRIGFGG